ncbi:MAG: hypothetical protein AAFN09_14840 [Pseudomonadota bacterium]
MANWIEAGATGRGYSDWEAGQAGPQAGQQTVSLFLRLSLADVAADQAEAEIDTCRFTMGRAGLTPAPHEMDRLLTEYLAVIAARQVSRWRFRLVAYAKREQIAAVEALSFVDVLHVGAPLEGGDASGLPTETPRAYLPGDATALCAPIGGVIDDGIAYLNALTWKDTGQSTDRTRFLGVWLQSIKAPEPGQVEIGRLLSQGDINEMIAQDDEREVYRGVNAGLVPITERASSDFRVSHGAHVLDLMAGVTPEPELEDQPHTIDERATRLLAVQLPSAAIADTSGRLNGRYVVTGLRWILLEALKANAGNGAGALVVNLSLGSLAGPGDTSSFMASWLSYEVAAYRLITGCDLRLSLAYGNSHRDKLSARAGLSPETPLDLDWRILPEDYTPSFLELRAAPGDIADMRLTITPPRAGPPAIQLSWTEAMGGFISRGPDGLPQAAILALGDLGGAPHDNDGSVGILIATAPTARREGGPAAAAGRWQVRLHKSAGQALVTANVQRDDSPAGYRVLGRQSWLDGPAAWSWDYQTRDWIMPEEPYDHDVLAMGAGGPVTRAGTAVAHAGAWASPSGASMSFVGAVKPRLGFPEEMVSNLFSAEGLPAGAAIDGLPARRAEESPGPDLCAMAGDGANLYGRLGSGVISGSTARLSGTSVAAPAVARAWLRQYWAQYHAGAQRPTAAIPLQKLLSRPRAADRDAILGFGNLAGQRAYTQGRVLG